MKIKMPTFSAKEVVATCLKDVDDTAFVSRILNSLDLISDDEKKYVELGPLERLHEFTVKASIGSASKDDMKQLYNQRLVQGKKDARGYYERLKLGAPGEICPFCGDRRVRHLDHYLPKAQFPSFAVTPANLVPSCADCNTTKLTAIASTPEELPLHPYFDDADDNTWLFAEIEHEEKSIVISFKAVPPSEWSVTKRMRVQFHFRQFGLAEAYSVQANRELQRSRLEYYTTAKEDGEESLRKMLKRRAFSTNAHRLNTWTGALYACLGNSDWFVNGGFLKIPVTKLEDGKTLLEPTNSKT